MARRHSGRMNRLVGRRSARRDRGGVLVRRDGPRRSRWNTSVRRSGRRLGRVSQCSGRLCRFCERHGGCDSYRESHTTIQRTISCHGYSSIHLLDPYVDYHDISCPARAATVQAAGALRQHGPGERYSLYSPCGLNRRLDRGGDTVRTGKPYRVRARRRPVAESIERWPERNHCSRPRQVWLEQPRHAASVVEFFCLHGAGGGVPGRAVYH